MLERTMPPAFDHGPRLSDAEYDRRIVALHEGQPAMPTREQDRAIRRRELDLAIDHRLGTAFPQEKRDALWNIQERVEKKRARLAIKSVFRGLLAKGLARDAQAAAAFLIEEYGKVLTRPELESFFGFENGTPPSLPVDLEQLRKK